MLLIDLDRKHPFELPLVAGIRDGLAKGFVQQFDAVLQNITEAEHQRRIDSPGFEFLQDAGHAVPVRAFHRSKVDFHLSLIGDTEKGSSPEGETIEVGGIRCGPGRRGVSSHW
jgi:hypothetical protein